MPLVSGKIIDGVGHAVEGAYVVATPVPAMVPALVPSADAEILVPAVVSTLSDGTWQMAMLAGTWLMQYRFGRNERAFYIAVPDLDGNYWVGDLITDQPCSAFPGEVVPGGDTGMITILEDGTAVVSNATELDFLSPGWILTDEGSGRVGIAMIASGVNALQFNGIDIDTASPLNRQVQMFDGTQYTLTEIIRLIDVGTVVQAFSDRLAAIDAAGQAADRIAYYTNNTNGVALTVLSAFGRTLIGSADANAALTNLTAIGEAQKNMSNGVAGLDPSGLLLATVLPDAAFTTVYNVADQTAMLALIPQKGDLAIRIDTSQTFVFLDGDPTQLANWKALPYQASNANLTALAGLTTAADKLTIWTGVGTASLFDITTRGRAVIAQIRDTFSNVNKTVGATTAMLAQTGTMTATRTVTLPAASAYPAGVKLLIADESGTVSAANAITIQRAGADLIDGVTTVTISFPYGYRSLVSDGTSKWSIVGQSPDVTDVTNLALGTRPNGPEIFAMSQGGAAVRTTHGDVISTPYDVWGGASGTEQMMWEDFDSNVAANTTDATIYGNQRVQLNLNVGGGAGAGAGGQQHATDLVGGHAVYGVGQLTTGTGATARASLGPFTANFQFQSAYTGGIRFMARVRIPTISDGTNTFVTQIGFLQTLASIASTDGLWVEAGAGANWRCKNARASTVTDGDSGIVVANTAYVNIGIWYDGTTVRYYMSTGINPLTLVVTQGTNLPTNATNLIPAILIVKSLGATARTLNIDGFGFRVPVERGLHGTGIRPL